VEYPTSSILISYSAIFASKNNGLQSPAEAHFAARYPILFLEKILILIAFQHARAVPPEARSTYRERKLTKVMLSLILTDE
jgi:hypothetical protein